MIAVNTVRTFSRLGLLLAAIIFGMLLAAYSTVALAAEVVARVDAIAGPVTVISADGAVRQLRKGSEIVAGDTIDTAVNGRVRLLFSDNGRVFVRPSSRFVIDSYHYSGDKQLDKSHFSLVKGGFRAITGAIGKGNHEKVRINTPVATIGIRGTDHEARYCNGDCRDFIADDGRDPADGLYTGTNAGCTFTGGLEFGAGQYGYTAVGRQTSRLADPPAILVNDPELRGALGTLHPAVYIPAQPRSVTSVPCR